MFLAARLARGYFGQFGRSAGPAAKGSPLGALILFLILISPIILPLLMVLAGAGLIWYVGFRLIQWAVKRGRR